MFALKAVPGGNCTFGERDRLRGEQLEHRASGYASCVKRFRAFLERLPGGHRPPTGPMTTEEATDAEALRRETSVDEKQGTEDEQDDANDDRKR
jgi:hypothetical protein